MDLTFRKPRLAASRHKGMSWSTLGRTLSLAFPCLVLSALPVLAQRPLAHPAPHQPAKAKTARNRPPIVPDRFTVILEDPPVATRFATREEMAGAAGVSYRAQVEARQASIAREIEGRNFHVTGSASRLVNAVFVSGPASRIDELRSVPGVVSVYPMRRFKPALNRAVAAMNASAAWTALGSASGGNAGAGIKIGIIDTGIDQTHPAFQDPSLKVPAGFPIYTAGHPEDAAYTNNKVIVARSYVRTLANEWIANSSNPAAQSQPDDYSPRDRMGHGTAVASVAAGFTNSGPGVTTAGGAVSFSGIAPKAYLGNYKIYGSPGINDLPMDDVMIQAVEDAVADGMDVINLSTGGVAFSDWSTDPVAAAYEAAATKTVVVIAAGDSGNDTYDLYSYYGYPGGYPYFNSVSSPGTAPSAITVGATLNSHLWLPSVSVASSSAPSNLKGIPAALGDSVIDDYYYPNFSGYPSPYGAESAPLIDVTTLGDDGTACNTLSAGTLVNKFALIKQGACDFDTQAYHAQTAGAVGVVFYGLNNSALVGPSGISSDFVGPTVIVSLADGTNLKNYIDAHPGQTVTIDVAGAEQDVAAFSTANGIYPPLAVNQFASYSSMGPTPDGMIKPDMVAIGGADLSATYGPLLGGGSGMYMATQSYDPTPQYTTGATLYSATGYMAADGTSFAAPLVAGAAALVKQAHPGFSPAQIKSALVNSAAQDVITDDFGFTVDAEWLGAGRLDAGAAVSARVTVQPPTLSFGYVPAAGPLPAPLSVTVTNTGAGPVTLSAAMAPSAFPNPTTSITVSPASLTLAAGASSTVTVTIAGAAPAAGEYSGILAFSASGSVVARVPCMGLVGDGLNPNVNVIWSEAFGGPGQDGGPLVVQVIDEMGVPMAGSPVTFSSESRGAFTFRSYVAAPTKLQPNPNSEPACSPASATSTVTCNTDKFGFAYVDVLLGAATGDFTIDISAGGYAFQGDAYIGTFAPVVNTVQDNATNIVGTISPGSYAAIKGANLVDSYYLSNYAVYNNLGYDLLSQYRLPLSMDFASVSFDVPSAGISLPGYMEFVSPTQVNVFVPWELAGQSSVQVKVTVDEGSYSNVVSVPLATYFPGFLLYNTNIAIAQDSNYNLISFANPAVRGQTITLYAGGLGPVTNPPIDGNAASTTQLSNTVTLPVVTIGGQTAKVLFSGLAPGLIGLYQVNATVPAGIAAGNQPITISIGGATSPTASVAAPGAPSQTIMIPVK